MGGYLPLAPGVSTVRYPIPERIFDYVSTVQSATDRGAYADLTNFHAGSMISPGFVSSGGRRSAAEGGSPNSDR